MIEEIVENKPYKSEAFVQELIRDNINFQKYIIDNLGHKYHGSERFVPEVKYINGITVDFKVIRDNEIIALVECKSGGINVTDYVRGIGQLLQYEYFREENITTHEETYSNKFKTVYFYPSDVIKNNSFNVARFKYPRSTQLLEVNIDNFIVRSIGEDELEKIEDVWVDKSAVSQYYFRDNRIFELYMLLTYISREDEKNVEAIKRSVAEKESLRRLETPNNNNWRNAFITLSTLGFINTDNMLNEAGKYMVQKTYEEFCLEIFNSYIKPYASTIVTAMENNPKIPLKDLAVNINRMFGDRPVLYLTDSKTRYLSSWLNIFRDDYGFIDFTARSSERKFIYNPFVLDDVTFLDNIKKYNKARKYLERQDHLIKMGVI